jgi:8-oxo-dGTP pyrophosphatase MutT (NUDIX family)
MRRPNETSASALPEGLKATLERRSRVTLARTKSIVCAVLVPIVVREGDYGVVYTLRSEHLPNHKGQVSFPGGKHSPAEDASLLDTALREAREEIGVAPENVQILGLLDDVYTMATDYVITPFVGLLRGNVSFRPNPREVEDVFTVSLDDLVNRAHHEKETKEWRGNSFEVDVITAGPHRIWGATHGITINLLDCVVDPAR